jgi:hypothetical protein
MPRFTPFRLAAVCALALITTLAFVAGASAKGFSAQLRVVGSGGKTLFEKPVATATTTLKTSPNAKCFGPGNEGSGEAVTIPGNSALGLLARGSATSGALRPLTLTDAFDFGLGLCGVGSSVAKGAASWYLKVNHKAPSLGGEKVKIKPGDEVLWALVKTVPPKYEYPDELVLAAPAKAQPGAPFSVRVWGYDGKGKRTPVAGARVTGAAPTGKDGRTMVTLAKPAQLAASDGADIPSARVAVCVGGKCPR